MKKLKSILPRNMATLRQLNQFSQEDVAERVGVFPGRLLQNGKLVNQYPIF